jgi:hypothetical protein
MYFSPFDWSQRSNILLTVATEHFYMGIICASGKLIFFDFTAKCFQQLRSRRTFRRCTSARTAQFYDAQFRRIAHQCSLGVSSIAHKAERIVSVPFSVGATQPARRSVPEEPCDLKELGSERHRTGRTVQNFTIERSEREFRTVSSGEERKFCLLGPCLLSAMPHQRRGDHLLHGDS